MLRRHAQLRTTLLVAGDLLATAAALALAYLLRFHSGLLGATKPWIPARYLEALPAAVLVCLVVYAVVGSYRPPRRSGVRGASARSAVGGVLAGDAALLIVAGALTYGGEYQFSRGLLLVFPLVAIPVVWAARKAAHGVLGALLVRGFGVTRAVVAGDGDRAAQIVRRLGDGSQAGIRVVRRVADPRQLPRALEETGAESVFLAYSAARHEDLVRATEILEEAMVDVRIVPDLPLRPTLNPDVTLLSGLPVVAVRETPFRGLSRLLKRGFDLLLGGLLLVLLTPVMLLCALSVLLLTGRPVFYGQERMGLDGRTFSILKFRTMRVDAEAETGAVWAAKGDPRRTPLGRVLRRFSLDELPQLLNVLRGEMSLVGPRPERPVLIESFRRALPGYMLRHRIPAGLTGWAQVNGCRGDGEITLRLQYDLDYLESWSLLFDVEILLRTVWQVLSGRSAV